MDYYSDFIRQLPVDVYRKTEARFGSSVVIFRPRNYLVGTIIHIKDYHIMLPAETPPPIFFNNGLFEYMPRRILSVNPGDVAYCTVNKPTKPFYSIMIKSQLLHQVAESMGFSGELRFENVLNPYSAELLQAILSLEKELGRPDRLQLMLDCLEIQLAVLLLREFKTNLGGHEAEAPDADAYVGIAADFIKTYYSSHITIEDICREIHVSPYHFIRKFKQKKGVSPYRYLLNTRIEKAEEYLRGKNLSVSETAMLCGFVSAAHFSSVFKLYTGFTPSEYKKGG
jgi:AraC family transcriptional regulator